MHRTSPPARHEPAPSTIRRRHGNLRLRPPLTAMGQGRGVYGRPRVLQSVRPQRAAPGWVVGTCVVRTHSHAMATMAPCTAAAHGRRTPRPRGTRATYTTTRAASARCVLSCGPAPPPPPALAAHRPPPPTTTLSLAVGQYHHPPSVTTGGSTSPAHMPPPRLHTRRHGLQYSFSLLPAASTHTRRTTPLRRPPSPSPPQCRPTPQPPSLPPNTTPSAASVMKIEKVSMLEDATSS